MKFHLKRADPEGLLLNVVLPEPTNLLFLNALLNPFFHREFYNPIVFLKHFSKPKKSFQDLVAIRRIFVNSGSLEYSLKAIKNRLRQSRQVFSTLNMNNTYRELITDSLLRLFKHSNAMAKANKINISVD